MTLIEHASGVICGRDCGPHEAEARETPMVGIKLPADGVMRMVDLDGVPLGVSVRVIPPAEVPPSA